MSRKEKNSPVSGITPKKTFWTVVWFVVFGATAVIWRFENEPPSSVKEDADIQTAMPGPLPIAPARLLEKIPSEVEPDQGTVGTPRIPHQPIEVPAGATMCHFYRALKELEKPATNTVARVLHYGDSILTTDELSGMARRILQRRFGDGGHGFVLLGKPWRWYHHLDVRHGARGDWMPRPLTSAPVRDGMFGLGGVAFETRAGNAKAWAGTVPDGPVGTRVAHFDISYLAQPRGGEFDLILNGEVIDTVSTASSVKETVHRRVNVSPGNAKLEVKTRGNGKVRVFGAVLKSGQKGVVYDSLAINGARASNLRRFNEDHWISELRRTGANLVVLMFGANEGYNDSLPLSEYSSQLSSVIETVRQGTPGSSCLVVGPLDQAKRKENGKLGSRRMPLKLSKAQRKVSFDHGCAFFDTIEAMGGVNSMAKWRRNGLGGGDLIHPTGHGARQIGTWLADALLAGYEEFIFGGEKCASSVTSL